MSAGTEAGARGAPGRRSGLKSGRLGAAWNRLARAELAWLAGSALLAAALLGFLEVAEAVLEGDTLAYDRAILLALRESSDLADPIGPDWIETAMLDLTSLGGYTVLTLVTLAAIVYLLANARRHTALLLGLSVGGGMLISNLLKASFGRIRPDLVPHAVEVSSASFPSGHALISAATYLTLGALLARVERRRALKIYFLAVATALTLVIGASRVYLGVHYPTDVLAGWLVGAAWAMLCWMLAAWLQRRGRIEGAPPEAPPGA